jgi:hypothetical protein
MSDKAGVEGLRERARKMSGLPWPAYQAHASK